MKRWLAKDTAEYLAEFKKHVTPELLAVQLYEIDSAAPPDYDPPSESLSQSSLDSSKHSEPS